MPLGDRRFHVARLAPDRQAIALIGKAPSDVGGYHEDQFWLYRRGRLALLDVRGFFVRDWVFLGDRYLAVYSGGLHFAGGYGLFDVRSGAWLAGEDDPLRPNSAEWAQQAFPESVQCDDETPAPSERHE